MAGTYQAQSGDTASGIAAANGITLSQFLANNPQVTNADMIYEGASYNLGGGTPTAPPAPGAGAPPPPTGGPGTTPQAGINGPMGSDTLADMNQAPDPFTLVTANNGMSNFSDKISQIAGATFGGTGKALDELRKQLQTQYGSEAEAAKKNVDALEAGVASNINSTQYQDTRNGIMSRFDVENKIQQYQDIQQRIVDAQEALQTGLVYEQDRPARMQLLTGRSASLQKQGLATIGALQGTAAVLKGNIDLAYAYAESTIDAIKADNDRSYNALTTLLTLENNKLVKLTDAERGIAEDRIKAIETENNKLKTGAKDITDLMTKYPTAFLKAGVTLLDSRETALAKMLPYLSAQEQGSLGTFASVFDKNDYGSLYNVGLNQEDITNIQDSIQTIGLEATLSPESGLTEPQKTIIRQSIANQSLKGNLDNAQIDQYYTADGTLKPEYKITYDSKGKPSYSKTSFKERNGQSWLASLFN